MFNGGYSYDANSHQFNYGDQGGIVAHSHGIAWHRSLTTPLSWLTRRAQGVAVSNRAGVMTDGRGFAVVPYANPYHKNSISLDTEQISNHSVDLQEATKYVYPTRGAVVEAGYRATIGYRALLTLAVQANGKPVPFGATVSVNATPTNENNSSIVGDDGQVYLSGLKDAGSVQVKWEMKGASQCTATYSLPERKSLSGIEILHANCL